MQKKGIIFHPRPKFYFNGQNNLLRALKWGILCFRNYYNFGDTASIKNAIFAICIVNLLVFTKLRKLENGYIHVFCSISKSIQDTEIYRVHLEKSYNYFFAIFLVISSERGCVSPCSHCTEDSAAKTKLVFEKSWLLSVLKRPKELWLQLCFARKSQNQQLWGEKRLVGLWFLTYNVALSLVTPQTASPV